MNPLTCAHLDCPNEPTHQQPVQTALMQQPVYYLVCAEHADGLLDSDDHYSYADVTIGQRKSQRDIDASNEAYLRRVGLVSSR